MGILMSQSKKKIYLWLTVRADGRGESR